MGNFHMVKTPKIIYYLLHQKDRTLGLAESA
jgi:hypothetical protein